MRSQAITFSCLFKIPTFGIPGLRRVNSLSLSFHHCESLLGVTGGTRGLGSSLSERVNISVNEASVLRIHTR